MVNWRGWGGVGREPPDAMSLRYAVNEPPPYSTAFFKSWFLWVMKTFNNFTKD